MCNSHNHRQPCNCGFGEGRNSSFSSRKSYYIERTNFADKVLKSFPINEFSITVPNAICPVCGEKVFFYQNNYGSRVFFDVLGKPWTKHPCTDNAMYSTVGEERRDVHLESNFFIPEVSKISKDSKLLQIRNSVLHKKFSFYDIFTNEYGRSMLIFSDVKYLLNEELLNRPDILIISESEGNFYLETYEIRYNESQKILLKPKNKNEVENLKHFGISNYEILQIAINHAIYNTKNLYSVDVKHYNKTMEMSLENFLESNQNNIKFLRYRNSENRNSFKVKIINNELFEIE